MSKRGTKCQQPRMYVSHQNSMRSPHIRHLALILAALLLPGMIACNTRENPDEIRRRTAEATETMRRDAKAVAEGVKEGMGREKTIDINKASREDLLSLPGLTERDADRIIAERPFENARDLVSRHVLPEQEFDRIRDRVIAGR